MRSPICWRQGLTKPSVALGRVYQELFQIRQIDEHMKLFVPNTKYRKRNYVASLYLLLAFGEISFSSENTRLKGTYFGFSLQTSWIYEFLDDSSFVFQTKGHFGNTTTRGTYKISNDTVNFAFDSKGTQEDTSAYFNSLGPLVIINDSCLFSPRLDEKYCKLTDARNKVAD